MILDDDVDLGAETTLAAKVDTQEGGMIKIRNEESISAFNIDINSLKTKDWKMDGDESDYFNYGFNEYMLDVKKLEEYSCILVARVPSVAISLICQTSDALSFACRRLQPSFDGSDSDFIRSEHGRVDGL